MDPLTMMAARKALKAAAPLIAAAALATAGFASGVAWEHRGPTRFPLSLAGKSLKVQRDELSAKISAPVTGYVARLAAMTADRDAWTAAHGRCEAKRREEAGQAADRVTQDSETKARASSGAFDQGYAAGRAAGQRTCGGSHAAKTTPSPGPGRGHAADGMRHPAGEDFAAAWERGAYRPGGSVSAQR